MRSATVSKWLQENANAPPPPVTPSGLPDDSVSTVYPESSVSNPYASRYTGSRHRTVATQQHVDRRPMSAQGHRRDREHYPQYAAPTTRHRNQSFSADARYVPTQAQPYGYAYAQPHSARQMYYAPQATHGYTRPTPQRSHSASRYNVAASSSPTRIDVVRPQPVRAYTTYANYASTPTISLQSRSTPNKKAPLLRRLFGLDWGSAPKPAPVYTTRASSRSSSKSKSHRSDSRSYNDQYRSTRPRRNSEGVVYLRY